MKRSPLFVVSVPIVLIVVTAGVLLLVMTNEGPRRAAIAAAPPNSNFSPPTLVSVWGNDAPAGWVAHNHRSQCIVRVRLSRHNRPITGYQWFRFLSQTGLYWIFMGPRLGMAGGKFHARNSSLFILFDRHCKERYESTLYMFTMMKYFAFGTPSFVVSTDNIHASKHTVRVCGHWWIGGENGVCHLGMAPPKKSYPMWYVLRWYQAWKRNGCFKKGKSTRRDAACMGLSG